MSESTERNLSIQLAWLAIAQMLDGRKCCFCGYEWNSRESVRERLPIVASKGMDEIACKPCWDSGKRLSSSAQSIAADAMESLATPQEDISERDARLEDSSVSVRPASDEAPREGGEADITAQPFRDERCMFRYDFPNMVCGANRSAHEPIRSHPFLFSTQSQSSDPQCSFVRHEAVRCIFTKSDHAATKTIDHDFVAAEPPRIDGSESEGYGDLAGIDRRARAIAASDTHDTDIQRLACEAIALVGEVRWLYALSERAREPLAELDRAIAKFPAWPTDPFHALGVLHEEVGEVSKALLQHVYEPERTTLEEVYTEAVQAAAMALRFLLNMPNYRFERCEQEPDATPPVENVPRTA